MLFGIICAVLILVSSVLFSLLAVLIDNFGDRCIEKIDGKF
ncbi:hypothetical protein [uncultured Treponema sp.]|nr:hypothetical protein [uncultured Treponema sp.]